MTFKREREMWKPLQNLFTKRAGSRALLGVTVASMLVGGCGDGAAAPSTTPTVRLRIQPNRVALATRGGQTTLAVLITDASGATYTPEGPVTYVARNTAMVTADATGRVTGGSQSGITYVVASTAFRGTVLSDSAEIAVLAPDGG